MTRPEDAAPARPAPISPRAESQDGGGPLGNRNFRLLFLGRSASLLGDGAFLVALAWQAYTMSNGPTALSLLGTAMTVPLVILLLFGGVVSDAHDRRRVMLIADGVRAVLLGALGALALTGAIRLWHMVVIVALYGGAQAFFDPASDAILPEVLAPAQLGRANTLEQVARPLTLRLAGPALAGFLIAAVGPGGGFLADAASFVVSGACVWRMSARPLAHTGEDAAGESVLARVGEGWAYVRRHVWLWGTFASAGLAYLLFMGPVEVLLPFVVKHELHGGSAALGLVLGAGGLGSVACALVMMRSGLPARSITFIYAVWTLGTLGVAAYGIATSIWQLMLASLAFSVLETAGTVVWTTLKQRQVPGHLLGRVSSLDWMISIGLLPVSFALAAPLSAALGARETLIAAGVAGAAATLGGLLLPGMRGVDGRLALDPRTPATRTGEGTAPA